MLQVRVYACNNSYVRLCRNCILCAFYSSKIIRFRSELSTAFINVLLSKENGSRKRVFTDFTNEKCEIAVHALKFAVNTLKMHFALSIE